MSDELRLGELYSAAGLKQQEAACQHQGEPCLARQHLAAHAGSQGWETNP